MTLTHRVKVHSDYIKTPLRDIFYINMESNRRNMEGLLVLLTHWEKTLQFCAAFNQFICHVYAAHADSMQGREQTSCVEVSQF